MRGSIRWIVLGTVVVVLLATLGILQACNRSDDEAESQPQAGGVVAESAESPEVEGTEPAATATPFVFTRGDEYTAAGELTLYATAASSTAVLDVFAPGSTFTVLEPNGEYDTYPVQSGGTSWVRVRAADGLVGWAKAESLGQ